MTEEHEIFRGFVNKQLLNVQHATIEIGPSPDGSWAFRITIHPLKSEKLARAGIEKMKMLLRPMGFTFKENQDYDRTKSKR